MFTNKGIRASLVSCENDMQLTILALSLVLMYAKIVASTAIICQEKELISRFYLRLNRHVFCIRLTCRFWVLCEGSITKSKLTCYLVAENDQCISCTMKNSSSGDQIKPSMNNGWLPFES